MNVQDGKIPTVDDLLKRTLAGELPPDVAAGMRRRIDRFRAERAAEGPPSSARTWLLPRTAWAALAVLMLMAGILLQGARVPSPLADRISSFKAAHAALEPTRR